MAETNGFARGGLDGPPRQWQVALRRLPLTLAILIFVGGTAAGLAYVASGSSSKGVEAVFVNDVGETVLYGGCDESDCKKGGALSPQQLTAGQRVRVRLALGQGGNPILVLTPAELLARLPKAPDA